MQPQIAKTEPETESCKPAQLKLIIDRCGDLNLIETQSGAYLLSFQGDKVVAYEAAQELLDGAGVDTTFADWDTRGRMIVRKR